MNMFRPMVSKETPPWTMFGFVGKGAGTWAIALNGVAIIMPARKTLQKRVIQGILGFSSRRSMPISLLGYVGKKEVLGSGFSIRD
jgi:hypothetical protein